MLTLVLCEVLTLVNSILFADDTSVLFYSTRNIVDTDTCIINNELERLDIWFRVNTLSLDVNITHLIIFANKTKRRPTTDITLNGMKIEQVSITKIPWCNNC